MEDLKKAIQERAEKPEHIKKEITRRIEEKIRREEAFLKNYDEVLNTRILNIFRKTIEETDRSHDHRALKIINGELVHMRLDSFQGQAEGIKVDFDSDNVPMYIWFNPDPSIQKIIFKIMYEGERISEIEHYDLEEIGSDFLIGLITKKYFTSEVALS